jgi:hypothetical protein
MQKLTLLPIPHLLVPLALALGACSTDDDGKAVESISGSGSDTESTSDSGESTAGTSATASSGTSGSGSGSSSSATTGESATTDAGTTDPGTTTGAPFEPYPARNLKVARVLASQGVAIPIAENGEWVGGADRNAPIVARRRTMIQAVWEREPGFEAREIRGVLTLTLADGTTQVASQTVLVDNDSNERFLNRSFYWVLPPEFIEPNLRFQIELFETQPGYEDQPDVGSKAFNGEPSPVGVEDSYMNLRAVIVPIRHESSSGCVGEAPTVTDADLEFMAKEINAQNPVEFVDIRVTEPVTYQGALSSFSPLLNFLATEVRPNDPDEDVSEYYYGVVRPCDGGAQGVGGQAIDIPSFPTKSNGWSRVSMGRWYGTIGSTTETFVHEVGHSQGRRHIDCGGAAGTDPRYPYEGGDIGVVGFHIFNFSTIGTTSKDYMTYCGPTWVSDWGWNQVYPFIEEISSWDNEAPAPAPGGQVLVGMIDPDGLETWFVVEGTLDGMQTTPASVVLDTAEGRFTLPAATSDVDGGTVSYAVALPSSAHGLRGVAKATRIAHDGSAHAVALPNVTVPARLRAAD